MCRHDTCHSRALRTAAVQHMPPALPWPGFNMMRLAAAASRVPEALGTDESTRVLPWRVQERARVQDVAELVLDNAAVQIERRNWPCPGHARAVCAGL